MTPYVTKSEFQEAIKLIKTLQQKNASLVEALKESVRQHHHYMKSRGEISKRQAMANQRAYEYRNKVDELKKLLGMVHLPKQAETKAGRRYLVRLDWNEYHKFRRMLKTDWRLKENAVASVESQG